MKRKELNKSFIMISNWKNTSGLLVYIKYFIASGVKDGDAVPVILYGAV